MSDNKIEMFKKTKQKKRRLSPSQLLSVTSSTDECSKLDLHNRFCFISKKPKITEQDIVAFLQRLVSSALSRRGTTDSNLHFNQNIWNNFLKDVHVNADKNYSLDKQDKYLSAIKKIAMFAKDNLPFDVNHENDAQDDFFDEKQNVIKQNNYIFSDNFYSHENLEDEKKHDTKQSKSVSVYNMSPSSKLELSKLLVAVKEEQEIEHKTTEEELQSNLDEQQALLLHHHLNSVDNIKNKKPTIYDEVKLMLNKLLLSILLNISDTEFEQQRKKNEAERAKSSREQRAKGQSLDSKRYSAIFTVQNPNKRFVGNTNLYPVG